MLWAWRGAALALAGLLCTAAPGKAAEVYGVEIFEAGLYESAEGASPGALTVVRRVRLVKGATRLPALARSIMGIRFTPIGYPAGARVSLRLKVTLAGKLRRQEVLRYSIGGKAFYGWFAGSRPQAGTLEISIWHQGRRLAAQRFTLYQP